MAGDGVMGRVERDLSRGHTQVAVNRLTMAAKASPADLALRSRLAAVHRQTGNWAEAGRWGYFENVLDERSRQAFEKAWRSPEAQRAALRWTRSDGDPEVVSARLDDLEARAMAMPTRAAHDGADALGTVGCLIVLALGLLFLLGVGTGIVTLVRWVV